MQISQHSSQCDSRIQRSSPDACEPQLATVLTRRDRPDLQSAERKVATTHGPGSQCCTVQTRAAAQSERESNGSSALAARTSVQCETQRVLKMIRWLTETALCRAALKQLWPLPCYIAT